MNRTAAMLLCTASACVQPLPSPTGVVDVRVLAASFETPEVLVAPCDPRLLVSVANGGTISEPPEALLAAGTRPLVYKALVADPEGGGRELSYKLRACTSLNDRECRNKDDSVELASGKAVAGEWSFPLDGRGSPIRPLLGTSVLPDGQFLMLKTLTQDSSRGLGGIRIPVVLEVKSPDTQELIYAQKLMVAQCQFFPSMRENVTPVLPGLMRNGALWPEDEVPELSASVTLEPVEFGELEESYTVPSLQLTPVTLAESWKLAWYTTFGTMSDFETGGTGFDGLERRHRSRWQPDTSVRAPRDVTFYVTVRDGRGGQSWLIRRAKWNP